MDRADNSAPCVTTLFWYFMHQASKTFYALKTVELPCYVTTLKFPQQLGSGFSLQPAGYGLAPAKNPFLGTRLALGGPKTPVGALVVRVATLWIILFVLNLKLFWNYLLRSSSKRNAVVDAVKTPCCPAPQPHRSQVTWRLSYPAPWRSSNPEPQLPSAPADANHVLADINPFLASGVLADVTPVLVSTSGVSGNTKPAPASGVLADTSVVP